MTDDRMSDRTEARKKAMDYLARREHARGELLNKLARFGFEPEVAADAIEGLIEDGLQSDERFAEAFVRSRINQGKGPGRIRADLNQRGIAAALVDEALAESGQDWFALAREVRLKKFGAACPTDFKEKARQIRFLRSRGFEPDQIQVAVSADLDSA